MKRTLLLILFFAAFFIQVRAQEKTILTVQVDRPVAEVQPTMWGIFFEDINFAADGGVYAELVKNRSFEFANPLMGWKQENYSPYSLNKESGNILIINEGSPEVTNRLARISVKDGNNYALVNEGFSGMGIKKDLAYDFSMYARIQNGNISIQVELIDDQKKVLGSSTVNPSGNTWTKYKASFTSSQTFEKANLRLSFIGNGVVDIDKVSLFPTDTWKKRPGGLRADLVQLLYDLKPGFIRFPGGCIVEGRDLAQRYQWKKTVGNVDLRQPMINRWNTEFQHRLAPDYFQSFGLGFYEYFQLAEDIGASPLPILSCGMACQFNTGELVPVDQLDPYIQDALDLIEFANGDATTNWGKLRTEMGHPKTFDLKMIGVGNEQWGPQYIERFKIFEKAIKAKYPEIKIVSSSGPGSEGELFDYAWSELKPLKAEIIDEHYYQKPEWFLKNTARYDSYDRKGPKIFAGEFAAQSVQTVSPDNKNNWQCALAEAAYMTGLERNADIVHMASYAPLLAHSERWQWTPNLIWFNNLQSYGTPSYFVQKLFSNNKGTNVLSILDNGKKVEGEKGIYASAVWDKNTKEIIVKLVNATDQLQSAEINLNSTKSLNPSAEMEVLHSDLTTVNSFENPASVAPKKSTLQIKGKIVKPALEPNSLTVIRVRAK